MKHPHHDLIVAWAADTTRVVQHRDDENKPWEDCVAQPYFSRNWEYRFKPVPKPDVVELAHIIKAQRSSPSDFDGWDFRPCPMYAPNVRLTFDGETDALKSVEILK